MRSRVDATVVLNNIKPFIDKEEKQQQDLEEGRNLLIELFQRKPEENLTPEEKQKIEKAVELLRNYLLEKLHEAAPEVSNTYSEEAFKIYQALILLAQCFPLNPKNAFDQPLAGKEEKGKHNYRTIDPSNRYISPTGYLFHMEDVDDSYNQGIIRSFEENRRPTNIFTRTEFIPMDKSRIAQLTVTHPHRFKDMEGDRGGYRFVSLGVGVISFIVITLLTVVTGGTVPFAGGILIVGGLLVAGGVSVGTGIAMERTILAAQEYFKNKKAQPIIPDDFSHEEALVKNLMNKNEQRQQELLTPSMPLAEPSVKKPFIPKELRYGVLNAANTGIAIGGLFSIAAAIAIGITVATGGGALPFLLTAGLIFGPPVLMPYVTSFGYLLYRGGSALKNRLTSKVSASQPENETQVDASSSQEQKGESTYQQETPLQSSPSMVSMLNASDTRSNDSGSLYPNLDNDNLDMKKIVNESISILTRGEALPEELLNLCNLITQFVQEVNDGVMLTKNPEYKFSQKYRGYIHLEKQPSSVQHAYQKFLDNYVRFFKKDILMKAKTADFINVVGSVNRVRDAFWNKLTEVQNYKKGSSATQGIFSSNKQRSSSDPSEKERPSSDYLKKAASQNVLKNK